MTYKHFAIAALLAGGCLAVASPAVAQRQDARPDTNPALPLCRLAEAGERCRTRDGTITTRRAPRPAAGPAVGQTNNLGGGDPGWELRDPRTGTERDPGQTNNLGGGDPGWEVQGEDGGKPPAATAAAVPQR
ncbi:hypothetical protein [Maricaulis salignorans]|uniref:hypothetical protein n=1 Tax=Maricaulis salignorans TaxID=144026 RepID=UPI003A93AFFA